MPTPTAIFTRAISATRTTTTITKAISTAAPATTKRLKHSFMVMEERKHKLLTTIISKMCGNALHLPAAKLMMVGRDVT